MEYRFEKERISFDKELNHLDVFVIDFCKTLYDLKIDFVVVSGYVSILFGRSKETEDVDLLIEETPFDVFKKLWTELSGNFECLNTLDCRGSFEYLKKANAVRFSRKGSFIPNIELKFQKTSIDRLTLNSAVEVVLNKKHKLRISPIETQIAYKLYLGSEKDIEDAKFLYELFFDNINHEKLAEVLSWFDKETMLRFKKIKRKW